MAGTSIVEPRDLPGVAAFLADANRARTPIAIRGSGTKRGWGSPLSRVDAVLSTTGLAGEIDHCAGDLTATVPAGATLLAVNETLARSGQCLPLDPATGDRATIGGIIATNDSGPRRQKHGTPRDLIIGVEMVRADGRIARAGGKVVKNVAGYDLARMLCGSFGTLAVVTSATFKLAPLAPASRTVVASARDGRSLADMIRAVAESPVAPSAVELEAPAQRLLVRFETTEVAADRQADATCDLCRRCGADARIVGEVEEANAWHEHERLVWGGASDDGRETIVKMSVLPVDVGAILEQLDGSVIGRAALGVLYMRIGPSPSAGPQRGSAKEAEHLTELRRRVAARGGSLVVLAAPDDVKAAVDSWGDLGGALPVMRAVKAQFDPNGILNPGLAPWG